MTFDEIILTPEEMKLLSEISDKPMPEPFSGEIQDSLIHLEALDMISFNHRTSLGKPGYEITATGTSYIRYVPQRKKIIAKSRQRSWAQVLIPAVVTVAIALLGLVSCNAQSDLPVESSVSVLGCIIGFH